MAGLSVACGLVACWLAGATAAAAVARAAEPADLPAYVRQLETLTDRWSVAATAADLGMIELARTALADTSGAPAAPYWTSTQQYLVHGLPQQAQADGVPAERPEPAWFDAAGRPDLAAKAYEARARLEELSWVDQWNWGRCLAECGRHVEAHELLSGITLPEDAADYAELLTEDVERLRARAGSRSVGRLAAYSQFGPEDPCAELPRIIAEWRAVRTPEDAISFADRFDLPEDPLGQRLARLWLADYPGVPRETAARALIDAAALLVPDRDAEAARVYRRVEWEFADTQARDLAVYGLGMTRKRAGDLDGAIAEFNRLFIAGLRGRRMIEPDGKLVVLLRHSKGQSYAMRALADCYYEQRRYADALRAHIRHRESRPRMVGCGMSFNQMEHDHAFHVALCLEHLGRHREAVVQHARAAVCYRDDKADAAGRLVALYEAAGQLNDLRAMLRDPENDYLLAAVKPALDRRRDAGPGLDGEVAAPGEWPSIPAGLVLPKNFSKELERALRD
jgi:hypothetical protein